jgi:hypothetical protein
MTHLHIPACAACPFAGDWGSGMFRRRACLAPPFLDRGNPDAEPRRFDLTADGLSRYPSPPPDWCPLRQGDLTIGV